jgi:uncharacterized protein YbjT (DUF2867 family)
MEQRIKVLITGSTGNAGSGVVKACLDHPAVAEVRVMTRRRLGKDHVKLVEVLHDDFLDYSAVEDHLSGLDACFWCLGVSQSKVRREADYHRITYEFTMEAAKVLERLNPGMTLCFLSGLGTDETQRSRMMWARIKGKAEADLLKMDLDVYNFRPGFIHPIKGERSSTIIGTLLYPFIKSSKKYCVEADEFGLAMINATLHGHEKRYVENRDIRLLAGKHPSG